MKSLRFYLVVTTLSAITLANFLAAIEGYKRSKLAAESLLDSHLSEYAELLFELKPNLAHEQKLIKEGARKHRLFRLTDAKGNLLLTNDLAFANFKISTTEKWFYENFEGARWRFYQVQNASQGIDLLVAERADIRTDYAEQVALSSISPLVFVIPVIGLAVWLIVQRALNALKKLSQAIALRESSNLQPIQLDETPRELRMLVDSTNQLLNRLSKALAREKNFTSDAAHELRTPIAALKVLLANHQKLLEAPASEPIDSQQSLQQIGLATERLHHLAEQLLDLHKSSAESLAESEKWIRLDEVIRSLVADVYPLFEQRQIEPLIEVVPFSVWATEYSLRAMLSNLISNAIKYTPVAGQMKITTDLAERRLSIEDSGPGIPETALERIFDRFYRVAETEKDRDTVGCGLGLAIVNEAAQHMHAQVKASRSDALGGLKIEIIFSGDRIK